MRDPSTIIDSNQSAIELAYAILCDMGMLGWGHWTDEDKNNEFRAERGRYANPHRDFAIALAVMLLREERGFNPTRNRANHNKPGDESGCAIVAAALARGRVLLGESAVEKIWQNQRREHPRFFVDS